MTLGTTPDTVAPGATGCGSTPARSCPARRRARRRRGGRARCGARSTASTRGPAPAACPLEPLLLRRCPRPLAGSAHRVRRHRAPSSARCRPGSCRTREDSDRWAVLVHGRGARRDESLRPCARSTTTGSTSLVPSYRNDEGARSGPDGRYNLGLSEWRDVEEACLYAVRRGPARSSSSGGRWVARSSCRPSTASSLADHVTRVVLDAPVIDWGDVFAHHARLNRIPHTVAPSAAR